MIGVDPVTRELERVERLRFALLSRGINFGVGNPQRLRRHVGAIEFPCQIDQCLIAARNHVRNDGSDRRFHVLRTFALRAEKIGEPLREIGIACV